MQVIHTNSGKPTEKTVQLRTKPGICRECIVSHNWNVPPEIFTDAESCKQRILELPSMPFSEQPLLVYLNQRADEECSPNKGKP